MSSAKWPMYEAFGLQGEYMREARVVGELPTPTDSRAALKGMLAPLSARLGLPARSELRFGLPACLSFGITRSAAKSHPEAKLLLSLGDELPLSLISPGDVA